MRKSKLPALALMGLAVLSCAKFQDAEWVSVEELAPRERLVMVERDGGDSYVKVWASGAVRASLLDAQKGITMLSSASLASDGDVVLHFEPNSSYRRAVRVALSLEGSDLRDTITFRQDGIEPFIRSGITSFVVDGKEGGSIIFPIETNIVGDLLQVSVSYDASAEGWIGSPVRSGDIAWDQDELLFPVEASAVDSPSRAFVRIAYNDAWEGELGVTTSVLRTSRTGGMGEKITFAGLASAAENAREFGPYQYYEAVVVSDCTSLNMAENPSTAYNVVDTEVSERTAYVVDPSSGRGVRLLFSSSLDNNLRQGMRVKISLSGAGILRETSPERYTLSGLSASSILEMAEGPAPVPVRRTVSQLSESDVYTLVTLTGVEFADQNGAYTNVYESRTLASEFNLSKVDNPTDGWGALLVSDEPSAIFAPVNFLCPWRRPVLGVPKGKLEVTGIVVSEPLKRIGNAGSLQIRVLDETGFVSTGAAAMNVAARWSGDAWKGGSDYSSPLPSEGENPIGQLSCSNTVSTPTARIRAMRNYSRLNYESDGCIDGRALGWCVGLSGWYKLAADGSIEGYNGFEFSLNTSGLSGNGLLAYISMICWGDRAYFRSFPAHWCVEYTLPGGEPVRVQCLTTGDGSFNLHSGPATQAYLNGRSYCPPSSMAPGFTDVAFALPAEVLGVEELSVRLTPCDASLFIWPSSAELFDEPADTGEFMAGMAANNDIRFNELSFRTI